MVGFAAETDSVVDYGREKLAAKGADLIVANEVGPQKGFGQDTNEVTLISAQGEQSLPSMPKRQLADVIFDAILELRG